MRRFRILFPMMLAGTVAVGLIGLAGCGQTGPLYLPKSEAKPTQTAPAPATAASTASVPTAAGR